MRDLTPQCRQIVRSPIKPCPRGGMVYFIGSDRGPIKIGWTQQNITSRLAALQNGNPEPLKVLATINGGHALESSYHSRFACLRYTGEWFLRSKALMDEIARLNELESHGRVKQKLTEGEAAEIRGNPQGLPKAQLAKNYGVSRMTVWKIQTGKSWAAKGD